MLDQQTVEWLKAHTEEFVQSLTGDGKAALLHSLMKHYTGPTEGLVASLRARMTELHGLMAPSDAEAIQARLSAVASAQASTNEQETFNYTMHALTTLGYDLTLMLMQATKAVTYAMEVVTSLSSRKLGHGPDIPLATSPDAVVTPPSPGAAPPECSPRPTPEAAEEDDDGAVC